MKHIAIMGGAFDPLHLAHGEMAELAVSTGAVEEVWLCPSPPRWDKTPIVALDRRVRWAQMAAEALKTKGISVKVSQEEIERGEYRGSYDFLSYLKAKHSSSEFSLILGRDSFATILNWRNPVTGTMNGASLLNDFQILLYDRGNADVSKIQGKRVRNMPTLSHEVQQLNSTALRVALANSNKLKSVWTFDAIARDIAHENPYRKL